MGSWNETCFLTRLPIFSGDPVRLLFVTPVPNDYRNTVHCNGWFMPVTLPVAGEYDDYGRIENCALDEPVLKILSMMKFRVRAGASKCEYHDVRLPALADKPAWQKTLTYLSGESRQGRLEAEIEHPGARAWQPVLCQMAHTWAYGFLSGAGKPGSDEYACSLSFRLSVAGPLRTALRTLDKDLAALAAFGPDKKPEPPMIPLAPAQELAGLMSAMENMRLAFGPTCGSGSQDSLDDSWQTEFYKQLFCRAASLPHRYDEDGQPEFSMAIAWDGDNLRADRNNKCGPCADLPETAGHEELRFEIMSKSIGCLLDAMDEVYTETNQ